MRSRTPPISSEFREGGRGFEHPKPRPRYATASASQKKKKSPNFTEPEDSSPHSQVPAICPYPDPFQSTPCRPSHLLKIHFNITLPFTPTSSKLPLSLRFPHQNPICTSLFHNTFHMLRPSHRLKTSVISREKSDHKASRYVVFSNPLPRRPTYHQILSPPPYSQTPSAYVPPSM